MPVILVKQARLQERKKAMKCPLCNDTVHVDYNLHSEGFSNGVLECGACGAVWSVSLGVTSIVRDRKGNDSFKTAA